MNWWKANHIYGWFVDNVQNGNDDCGEYDVSEEHLCKLLDVCEKVLEHYDLVDGSVQKSTVFSDANPKSYLVRETGKVVSDDRVARELLPRRAGLFFGSQEYDGEYLSDVVDTCEWLWRTIDDMKAGNPGHIIYSSNW